MTPDNAAQRALPELPVPFDYAYKFASPFGGDVWRMSSNAWNGNKPTGSAALFTAEQMQAFAISARESQPADVPIAMLRRAFLVSDGTLPDLIGHFCNEWNAALAAAPKAAAAPEGEAVGMRVLIAITREKNKMERALELACGYLTDEQAHEVAAAMPDETGIPASSDAPPGWKRTPNGWEVDPKCPACGKACKVIAEYRCEPCGESFYGLQGGAQSTDIHHSLTDAEKTNLLRSIHLTWAIGAAYTWEDLHDAMDAALSAGGRGGKSAP